MAQAINVEGIIAAGLCLAGLLMVVTAIPIVQNSLIAQTSIDTVRQMRRDYPVSTADLRVSLSTLRAGRGVAIGDRLIDQGIITLALADRLSEADPERLSLLGESLALNERRIARAPHDVHAWTRMAYARFLIDGPSQQTIETLRRSYEAGPYEYHVLWSRFRLGAALWPFLDNDLRGLTMGQATTALVADGGAHELARVYWDMPTDVQAEIMRATEGNSARSAFERFVLIEQERQGR